VVALVLPMLSAALHMTMESALKEALQKYDETKDAKLSNRLKAGRDLNRKQEILAEGEAMDIEDVAKKPTNTLKNVAASEKKKEKKKLRKDAPKLDMDLAATYANAEKVLEDVEVKAEPSKAPFHPRMEIISSEWEVGKDSNVEVFWQRPTGTIKGVMFGATGCFHQGGDFFEQHQNGWEFAECKNSKLRRCQGLPENVYFFKYARARGYLVMTITPQGKNSCWDHESDPMRVNLALQHVLKKEGLPLNTTMYASGVSQGGYFMFDMQKAGLPNLKCIAPQCAELRKRTGEEHLPTMMIYMRKDDSIYGDVQSSIQYLKKRLNGKVAVRQVHPWAVHELMIARGFPADKVERVKKALRNSKGPYGHKPITGNGYIVDHPGTDGWWRKNVQRVFPRNEDSLMKDHSVMHQVMQASYAEHEFTAEYADHIIDFCESEGLIDPTTPLRFGRTIEGDGKFDPQASGIHGAYE